MIQVKNNEKVLIYENITPIEGKYKASAHSLEFLEKIITEGNDPDLDYKADKYNKILKLLKEKDLLEKNFTPKKNLKDNKELFKEYKTISDDYKKYKTYYLKCFINCLTRDNKRETKSIIEFTNKATIDIDHISLQDKNIQEIFYLLSQDKYVNMLFYSPSGDGIKIICKLDHPEGAYEIEDIIEWYEWTYLKLIKHFSELTCLGIDDTHDMIRACFIPKTTEVIINKDAEPFKTYEDWKNEDIKRVIKKNASGTTKFNARINKKHKKLAETFIDLVNQTGVSIFSDYHEWVKLAFVLAYLYGKNGAAIFLELSKNDANFNPVACNTQFNIALKNLDPNRLIQPDKWLLKKLTDNGYTLKQTDIELKGMVYRESDYTSMRDELGVTIYMDEMNCDKYISFNKSKERRMEDHILNKYIVDLKLNFNDKLKKSELETYMFSQDNMIIRHYLKERIEKLNYDKADEFEKMLSYIITQQPDDLKRNTIKRWMLGAFKNVYEDYYDEILVLIGGQGKGKTTFINYFLSPFRNWTCSNFLFKPENKDEMKKLVDNMFIYDSENIAFKKSEIEIVKRITSSYLIDYRTQFAKFSTKLKRIATFIMDTNQEIIFNDDSGGRRYLILNIDDLIIYPQQGSKLKEIDYEKVWAYIYSEYKKGVRPDMINIDGQNEYRENSRLKKELEIIIEEMFDKGDTFVSNKEIVNMVKSYIITNYPDQVGLLKSEYVSNNIGRKMHNLNFKHKNIKIDGKSTRGYMVKIKDNKYDFEDPINKMLDNIIDSGQEITDEQRELFNLMSKQNKETINKLN